MTSGSSTRRNRQPWVFPPVGAADGGVQDRGLDVHRDRVGPHPAHGPGRVERLEDVHGSLPGGAGRPRLATGRGSPYLARPGPGRGAAPARARTPGCYEPGVAATPTAPDDLVELEVGAVAAGGGCVARGPDGRVVFVRHSLPGERVLARVTSEATSFLRADAVEVLEASPDRVAPAVPARRSRPVRRL